jgi:hypothetical protein
MSSIGSKFDFGEMEAKRDTTTPVMVQKVVLP